jgi:hypothetical protein
MDISYERNYQGAWVLRAIVGGYLFTRTYMGYTKREATALFRQEAKTA